MAAQVAANAQKTGKLVVYFDSESAIDPDFLSRAGCDLEQLMYIQASSVEFVLETIEELLGATDDKLVFIWDSLAFTPSVSDVEGDFNPAVLDGSEGAHSRKRNVKVSIAYCRQASNAYCAQPAKDQYPTRTERTYCGNDDTLHHPRW